MLRRFFTPRWQHRDPRVRQEAVRSLDPDNTEAAEILATLARGDASDEVRASASGRITDLQLLDWIIQQDRSATVREAAARQVCALLAGSAEGAPVLENRLRVVRLTSNQEVLGRVARDGQEQALRIEALGRLEEPSALLDFALHAPTAAERRSAAERVTDPTLLRRLSREGRDKPVMQLARGRLREQQQAQQQQQRRAEQRTKLLEQLQAHAGRAPDPLYEARLQQLLREWEPLAFDTPDEVAEKAQALLAACEEKRDEARRMEAEQALQQRARDEQAATLAQLEALLRELDSGTWSQQAGSLRAAVDTQRRRWDTALEQHEPDEALRERVETLLATWRELFELADRAASAAAEEDSATLRELAGQWPADIPAPDILSGAEATPRDSGASEARHESEALRPILGALRRELRKRNLRHVNRLWHKAEKLLEEHPDEAGRQQLEKLRPERDELRDWHEFAAGPKKEALCERMEALAEQPLEPEEQAGALQALHDEWRDLMSSDQEADQALWDRFRTASDRAWEPCREHFRELDAERAANLEKRRQLCDQLETFLQKLDPDHADWPAVWEIRRQAPQEWRGYRPVRFTDAREEARRFDALLKELDQRLDAASTRHLPRLEQLVQQVEALAESEQPEAHTEEARELQTQWKRAGWVLPRQYRPFHRRFRRACDRIFAARDQMRQQQRQEYEVQARALSDALEQLATLLKTSPADIDSGALGRAIEETAALPCPPREKTLGKKRDELLASARRLQRELPRRHDWQRRLEALREAPVAEVVPEQRELAVAAEVLAGVESPEDAREERMAWQLEQLPRAMKGAGAGEPPLEQVLRLLEKSPVVPEDGLDTSIRERLVRVLESLEPGASS